MNEKRSKVIEYLSENCSADTVINLLMQFVTEENWEQLYDQLANDGIPYFCEEQEEDTPEEVKKALEYVREQLEQDELDEIRAQVDRSYRYHMNPSACVTNDSKVIDLLEEYVFDNDLPEGWWESYGEIDEWLLKL